VNPFRAPHIPHKPSASVPPFDVKNDAPPLTVAEQVAADPELKAHGTVISKLTPPKPEAEPRSIEEIKRPGGKMIVRDF
jgi:hypothetical protein